MKIVIAGSSGLIGTALKKRLEDSGHNVHALVRKKPRKDTDIFWDPSSQDLDLAELEGTDAIINLAGTSIAKPWTRSHIESMYSSRLGSTSLIVKAIEAMDTKPQVFISGSASGFYGDRDDEVLTDFAETGEGILSSLCQAWEHEAHRADAYTRVATMRTGIVLSSKGGALQPIITGLRLGIASYLGNGKNWWPWIALEDEVRAIEFIMNSELQGPVNLCGPQEAQMETILEELSSVYKSKFDVKVPHSFLQKILGNFAEELLLSSQRMHPEKLEEAGFKFRYNKLNQALEAVKNKEF